MGAHTFWNFRRPPIFAVFLFPPTCPEQTTDTRQTRHCGVWPNGQYFHLSRSKSVCHTPLHDHERLEIADLMQGLFLPNDDPNKLSMDEWVDALGYRGFDAILYYGYDFIEYCVEHDIPMILTTRQDTRKWAKSWAFSVKLIDTLSQRPFAYSKTIQQILPSMHYVTKVIPTGGHPDQYLDMDTLEAGYHKHIAKVKRMVPSHLLLEYNVQQGWKPLCKFLGISQIPADDFPHVNDRVVMQAIIATFTIVAWIWPLLLGMAAYLVLKFIQLFIRRFFMTNSKATINEKKKN